jgi:hypothetical protein
MKISEMTNDQLCDALLRVTGPFANITEDPDCAPLVEGFNKISKGEMALADAAKALLPKVIVFGMGHDKHRADVYEIIGALLDVPTEQVRTMNPLVTIKAVRENWDETISSFFPSSPKQESANTAE